MLQLVPVIENKSAEASNIAFPNIFFIMLFWLIVIFLYKDSIIIELVMPKGLALFFFLHAIVCTKRRSCKGKPLCFRSRMTYSYFQVMVLRSAITVISSPLTSSLNQIFQQPSAEDNLKRSLGSEPYQVCLSSLFSPT